MSIVIKFSRRSGGCVTQCSLVYRYQSLRAGISKRVVARTSLTGRGAEIKTRTPWSQCKIFAEFHSAINKM